MDKFRRISLYLIIIFILFIIYILLFHFFGKGIALSINTILSIFLLALKKERRTLFIILSLLLIIFIWSSPYLQTWDDKIFNNFELYIINYDYISLDKNLVGLPYPTQGFNIPSLNFSDFIYDYQDTFFLIQGCKDQKFEGIRQFYFVNISKDCIVSFEDLSLVPHIFIECINRACTTSNIIFKNKRRAASLPLLNLCGELSGEFRSEAGVSELPREINIEGLSEYKCIQATNIENSKLIGQINHEYKKDIDISCKDINCKKCKVDIAPFLILPSKESYEMGLISSINIPNWYNKTIEIPNIPKEGVHVYFLSEDESKLEDLGEQSWGDKYCEFIETLKNSIPSFS